MIAAVHGMAAGGALYFLNECDIIICSDDATFFDPHVNFGMVAALEPIGLFRRLPMQEISRFVLLGKDIRMTAERAVQLGFASEVMPREELWPRAHELAALIATARRARSRGRSARCGMRSTCRATRRTPPG